ncbi:MAG: dihydrodipicolinate synthase family protein, partial [Candidatus Hydrogenedentota bacterium]
LTGAKGSVASTGNVAAKFLLGVYNNIQKGDLKQAWAFQQKLNEVCKMFRYGGLHALLKEALRLQGIEAGYVRPPQRELTAQEKRRLAKDMERLGLV